MEVVEMKKIIKYFVILILALIILAVIYPIIVPQKVQNYMQYDISRSERISMFQEISKNCTTHNGSYIMEFVVYYDNYRGDKNASMCWSKYYEKCLYNKDNNLTLKIPINCPIH